MKSRQSFTNANSKHNPFCPNVQRKGYFSLEYYTSWRRGGARKQGNRNMSCFKSHVVEWGNWYHGHETLSAPKSWWGQVPLLTAQHAGSALEVRSGWMARCNPAQVTHGCYMRGLWWIPLALCKTGKGYQELSLEVIQSTGHSELTWAGTTR